MRLPLNNAPFGLVPRRLPERRTTAGPTTPPPATRSEPASNAPPATDAEREDGLPIFPFIYSADDLRSYWSTLNVAVGLLLATSGSVLVGLITAADAAVRSGRHYVAWSLVCFTFTLLINLRQQIAFATASSGPGRTRDKSEADEALAAEYLQDHLSRYFTFWFSGNVYVKQCQTARQKAANQAARNEAQHKREKAERLRLIALEARTATLEKCQEANATELANAIYAEARMQDEEAKLQKQEALYQHDEACSQSRGSNARREELSRQAETASRSREEASRERQEASRRREREIRKVNRENQQRSSQDVGLSVQLRLDCWLTSWQEVREAGRQREEASRQLEAAHRLRESKERQRQALLTAAQTSPRLGESFANCLNAHIMRNSLSSWRIRRFLAFLYFQTFACLQTSAIVTLVVGLALLGASLVQISLVPEGALMVATTGILLLDLGPATFIHFILVPSEYYD